MRASKTKRSIFLRTFSCLLGIWLVLMLGFSAYLLHSSKKSAETVFEQDANSASSSLSSPALDNVGDNKLPIALTSLSQRTFSNRAFDYAVYSHDYKLLYDTEDTWMCSYSIPNGAFSWKAGYGYFYPKKWYSEAEIKELKNYSTYKGVKKVGELSSYSVNLNCWLNGTEIIPDKIEVVPLYISSIDENGNETGSGSYIAGSVPEFKSGYQNLSGLTHYDHAQILKTGSDSAQKSMTHPAVTDQKRLEDSATNFTAKILSGSALYTETIGLFTERYYMVMPYNSALKQIDGKLTADYWIALSGACNYFSSILSTLLFLWLICLFVFSGTAWILSEQTWKTYRKQEELERQRIDTTNAIAHDLKTPLATISGYAENLIDNIHTEKREHYAEHIRDNAQRMDRIVQEMLNLSRLEYGMQRINPEAFSLKELTEDISGGFEDAFAEKDISFSILGDAVITADKVLISRAINNFVSNALANTIQGGNINIMIGDHRWSIANTGNMIPENQLDAIWQAYYKMDAARSNPKGTGLGLSIVKSIMDIHGFTCGVDNASEGPIFWFAFK